MTSNYRDFSVPNGDRRQPQPDLADLFDGTRSRYTYQVEGLHDLLVDCCGDEYLEEHHEVEFLISEEESRTLAEIVVAEQEFFDRVWYVRSIVRSGEDTLGLPDDIRAGMVEARQRI